jgi:ATP-binding cassette subfamily B multidrug efflux pump
MSGDLGYLRRLWPHLKGDRWLYGLALAFAPLTAAMVVAQPYLLKSAIDDGITGGDLAAIRSVALVYLGVVVLEFLAQAAYTLFITYASTRTIARLRATVYAHTMGLAQSTFDREPTGKLLTRATSDVDALGETLSAGAFTLVVDVLLVIGILVAMFSLDPWLTLIVLLSAPLLAFGVDRVRRVLRRLYGQVRTSLSSLNAFTAERLNGLEVVQLYRDEARTLGEYDARLTRYRDATIRTNIWDALLYASMDGMRSITLALMLYYGSGGLFDGAVTAGLLAAFIEYVSRLYQPIQEFSSKVAILQRAASALEKIFGLLDMDDHITAGSTELDAPVGHIVVKDLRFAYRGGHDVLRGVDLEVLPGEVVAIVGRTGSGKTTLGKLLLRMYDGYSGSITVDGHELSSLSPRSVRRAIGTVRQDVQLFPGDVRFNLALGRELGDEALHAAIGRAHATAAVANLGGLDGRVEHQGANLSVGEAQLLSFARTMAHDPPIVVLDEATASVDSLTEAKVQAATREVLDDKTVIVIAHRLSTVMSADRIAVMSDGVVAESGTHDELVAAGGMYARLVAEDLASREPEPA